MSISFRKDFIFIRHGEAQGNIQGLCQGKIDFPLTALGRKQAFEAARKLKHLGTWHSLYSSDLARAVETAQIVGDELLCAKIIQEPGLQERGWGALDGQSNSLMFEREELETTVQQDSLPPILGLEILSDFNLRIVTTMNKILSEADNQMPLIVGHGRFFRNLCLILGCETQKQLANAAPVVCRSLENRWMLEFL